MSKDSDMAKRVASRIIKAMAYNRNTFKDRLEEHIGGALLEYYKYTLAIRIGQTKWVEHWQNEVEVLIGRNLVTALKHDIRGFKDRQKSLDEVIASLQAKDAGYKHTAQNIIKKDYNLSKVPKGLTEADTEAFWKKVLDTSKIALAKI